MLNATQIADLGPGVVYGIARSASGDVLVMNTDEHLAEIPGAQNLMQRPS